MTTMSAYSAILAVTGILIIAGLGIYAGRLLYLVQQQKAKQLAVRKKRVASMQSSIQTIAFAMQQQQCDLSEGVIRICRLLEALPIEPLPNFANKFPATHALFELVKDYPTHELRSALPKQEIRRQDKQRQENESILESEILKETEALREFAT